MSVPIQLLLHETLIRTFMTIGRWLLVPVIKIKFGKHLDSTSKIGMLYVENL
jgi:hypothetical protein